MIGNRVYGPLMRLEIKVNPIPPGGSGRNMPSYQEIVCLYVFSIFDPCIYCSAWLRLNPVWYGPSVMNIWYGGGAKTPALHITDIYQSI